jgi:hypothetical protein
MKGFFTFQKEKKDVRLSVYTLPRIIYSKYDGLILFLISLINIFDIMFFYTGVSILV